MLDNRLNFTATHSKEKPTIENVDKKQLNDNKKSNKGVFLGLSLVTLTTIGGIYYFTKHGNNKNIKNYSNNNFNKIPQFFETRTNCTSKFEENTPTLKEKNNWNAVTTAFKGEKQNENRTLTSDISEESFVSHKETIRKKTTKNNWREVRNSEIVPGIIRQISKDIKDYFNACGIDKNNNKVNPGRLDEILTKAVGEKNVKEHPFMENGKFGLGRIKEYQSPNGRIYFLETHDSSKGVITRLYMNCPDKHLRAYLHADGTFRLNSYTSNEAHFSTTAKGKRWMEESKFLKK